MQERKNEFSLGGNSIIGAIIMIVTLIGIYFLAGFVIALLYKWALLLLIPTAIIDYKVITGYFKWLGRLTKSNMATGLTGIVFSALFYPFVTLFLFEKTIKKKKIKQVEKEAVKQREGEFIEYEEMTEELPLELPEVKTPEKETRKGDYENLFEE